MRILDVSAITDSKQFFPKQGTLQFLQDAYKEQFNNLAQSLVQALGNTYSPSTIYVLWGCVNSGSGSTYNISEGAVLFNGEVFSVPAVNLTASGNVPVANISVAQYTTNADPVTYSDATTANIHNIRTISIGLGASGSTISDYSAFVFLQYVTPSQVLIKGSTTAFTPTIATDPVNKGYVDAQIGAKCVYAALYNHSSNTFSDVYNPSSLSVSGSASGANFTINHNLGSSNFITVTGASVGSYGSVTSKTNNYFIVNTGFGGSTDTAEDFYFQIWQHS
jgi:hypothetical protein